MVARRVVLGLLAIPVLLLAACGGGDDVAGEEAVRIDLAEQSDSGQSGSATLTPTGAGQTEVVVELSDAPDNPQPVHIHEGTCDDLNPEPEFPLEDLRDGESRTTVDVALERLQSGEFAINAHESAEQLDVYVACGNIASNGDGG